MTVSLENVKKLREETQAKIIECKKALEETNGNLKEAKKILRKKGLEIAEKKSGIQTNQGIITSYIHHDGRMGALVEIHCQSDFVARNRDFVDFCGNVAMHIAAFSPDWISPKDVPETVIKEEESVLRVQAESERKPEHIVEKIIQGRLKKFYDRHCLLNQIFLKEEDKTVQDVLQELIARLGENMKIHRFIRYELEASSGEN